MSDKKRCSTHKENKLRYLQWHVLAAEKYARGIYQRQCPKCERWFFHGEFGTGWSKAKEAK